MLFLQVQKGLIVPLDIKIEDLMKQFFYLFILQLHSAFLDMQSALHSGGLVSSTSV